MAFSFPAVERTNISTGSDGKRLSSDNGVMPPGERPLGVADTPAAVIQDEHYLSRVTQISRPTIPARTAPGRNESQANAGSTFDLV